MVPLLLHFIFLWFYEFRRNCYLLWSWRTVFMWELLTQVFLPGKPWTEEPGGLQSIGLQSWPSLSDWAHPRIPFTSRTAGVRSDFPRDTCHILGVCWLPSPWHGLWVVLLWAETACAGCWAGASSLLCGCHSPAWGRVSCWSRSRQIHFWAAVWSRHAWGTYAGSGATEYSSTGAVHSEACSCPLGGMLCKAYPCQVDCCWHCPQPCLDLGMQTVSSAVPRPLCSPSRQCRFVGRTSAEVRHWDHRNQEPGLAVGTMGSVWTLVLPPQAQPCSPSHKSTDNLLRCKYGCQGMACFPLVHWFTMGLLWWIRACLVHPQLRLRQHWTYSSPLPRSVHWSPSVSSQPSFRTEGEIKSFSDNQKLKEYSNTNSILKEILKGLL